MSSGQRGSYALAMTTTFRARAAAVLATLALASAPFVGTTPQATAQPNGTKVTKVGSARVETTFNKKGSTAQISKAVALINGAPSGATIRMGIYNVTHSSIVSAIRRAHNRGVRVYVVMNGSHARDAVPQKIRAIIGSRFKNCASKGTNPCISTASGHMHAKYMTLSTTRDSAGTVRKKVVWYSSANFSASGWDLSNNAVTVYGDSALYAGFLSDVWTPMWEQRSYSGNDYYVAGSERGYVDSRYSKHTVYVSPEQTTDLVANRLAYVNPGRDCDVRVMQAQVTGSRSAVLKQLVRLKKGGCGVRLVTGKGTTGLTASARSTLNKGGISDAYIESQKPIHDKAFIIKARYAGSSTPRYVVLTGSHNVTGPALRSNDEILTKVTDSKGFYDGFRSHFDDVYYG